MEDSPNPATEPTALAVVEPAAEPTQVEVLEARIAELEARIAELEAVPSVPVIRFPRMLYHDSEEPRIVKNQDEQDKLIEQGWTTDHVVIRDRWNPSAPILHRSPAAH